MNRNSKNEGHSAGVPWVVGNATIKHLLTNTWKNFFAGKFGFFGPEFEGKNRASVNVGISRVYKDENF